MMASLMVLFGGMRSEMLWSSVHVPLGDRLRGGGVGSPSFVGETSLRRRLRDNFAGTEDWLDGIPVG